VDLGGPKEARVQSYLLYPSPQRVGFEEGAMPLLWKKFCGGGGGGRGGAE